MIRKRTVGELLRQGIELMGKKPDAVLAAEVLMAYCLGVTREKLFIDAQAVPSYQIGENFLRLATAHARGEPVAYLTGSKEFYGLDFKVDRRVLIPRPETELLVDLVVEKSLLYPDGCRVLDVGTGSGCIAVAVAKLNQKVKVVACDVSESALAVARENAVRHGVEQVVKFVCSDLMSAISGYFDLIVANLPYIGREKFNFFSKEALEYEPELALFGGSDGLDLYRRLFGQVSMLRRKPRFLIGEFGFLQGDDIRKLLSRYFPQAKVEIKSDYASIERVFVVEFPCHK